MKEMDRLVLAGLIMAVDVGFFFLPLTGLFAAYILVARPPWFQEWVETLYS